MPTLSNRKPRNWLWTRTSTARRLFSISRWLHIYISTTLFSLLIFFSITGITLNHADWTGTGSPAIETELTLAPTLLARLQQQDTAAIADLQAWLEHNTGLVQPRSLDSDWGLGEISFDYPLPAGYVFITVFVDDGTALIESKKGSLLGLLNDLHKGRHSGPAWSLLIDISALLMCIFSLTGLIILLQHKRYRSAGLIAAVSGTLAPWLLYLWLVPGFSI